MHLTHWEIETAGMGPVAFTELAVLQALGVCLLVFLPEEHEGDALAGELPMHDGPIRQRPYQGRWRHHGEQPRLQGRFIQIVRQRPGQARSLRPAHIFGDRGP